MKRKKIKALALIASLSMAFISYFIIGYFFSVQPF